MKLQCPICHQEFPKFDQRGFRNAGFTSHYNRCLERQREQHGEHDQRSSRASRFARAIRRRLLPAQQQQEQQQSWLAPSIQLGNFQAGDGSAIKFNGPFVSSSLSSPQRYYQGSETNNSSHLLFQNHYQQQQPQPQPQQTDHHQNDNSINNSESNNINYSSPSFLMNESFSMMGPIPTTSMTTSPILCNSNNNTSMNAIHNIRPCRSLPILDYVDPTTPSSSPVIFSTTTSTLSDIVTDTVSLSSEWFPSPTLSSAMIMPLPMIHSVITATNTTTLLAESPMTTHCFDHNNNNDAFHPSLSITQDSFIMPHPIETNIPPSSSSSSLPTSTTTVRHSSFIDYHPSITTSSMTTTPTPTPTTTATNNQPFMHHDFLSSPSSPISSISNIPSHLFSFMDPTIDSSTPSTSSSTTTHFISTATTIDTNNINNIIYDFSFYYCHYCQSQNGYHHSNCSLINYFVYSNNNDDDNNN